MPARASLRVWCLAVVLGGVGASLAASGCARGSHRTGERDGAATGLDAGRGSDAGGSLDAGRDSDAAVGSDASPRLDAERGLDAAPGSDAASPSDAGGGGTGLDPRLRPADPSGARCDTPGSMSECPGIAVCRFFSATESRCESCSDCGNLGDPCAGGADCDILFACYAGRCTNICPLGTKYCGAPSDCLDVGHATYGVCAP